MGYVLGVGMIVGVVLCGLVWGEWYRQRWERKFFAAVQERKLKKRQEVIIRIGLGDVEVVDQCRIAISDLKIRLEQLDGLLNGGYWSEEYHFNTKESALGVIGAAHDRCWRMTADLNRVLVVHDFLPKAGYLPPNYPGDLKRFQLVDASQEVSH